MADLNAVLAALLSNDNEVRLSTCTCLSVAAARQIVRWTPMQHTLSAFLLQARKRAEEALKAFQAKPEIVPELLQRVQHSQDVQIRHLSAVLLKKSIAKHWQHLPAEVRVWAAMGLHGEREVCMGPS